MKNRGFLILGALVILVGGYAGYDYWSDKQDAKLKADRARLVKFDKDQIQDVVLTHGADKIHLQRTQEGWKITEPLQEVANQSAVSDFVEGITFEKSVDVVKEGEGIDWKLFGLEPPQATLTLINNSGEKVELAISSQKNYIGDYYLRPVGQNKILTVSASWNVKAQKKVLDFRDRRMLKKPSAAVTQMNVAQKGKTLHLEKKDAIWSSSDQPTWKLDQTRSNEIPFMLNNTNGLDIVKEPPVSPADLKKFNLEKPALSIQLQIKDAGPWHAEFSEATKQKEVFAHTSDPDRILKIQPSDLLKFQNLTLDFLRDRHEIFDFDLNHVRTIEISQVVGDSERHLKAERKDDQKDNKWSIVQSSPEAKADAILSLLGQLKSAEISDFDLPKAQWPIAKTEGKSSLVLRDETGKVLLDLRWGLQYNKDFGKGVKSMVAIQSKAKEDVWYGIEESRLQNWGFSQIWPEVKVPADQTKNKGKDK